MEVTLQVVNYLNRVVNYLNRVVFSIDGGYSSGIKNGLKQGKKVSI